MATNFPTSLDNLTNPAGSDPVNNPSHASQHANLNDAIEKLEEKVGVNNSAVTTSLDYRVKQLETNPVASYTDEDARDAIALALRTSGGITVSSDDIANTITLSTDSTIATKTYVDTAVSNLGSTAASTYVPVSEVGNADGIATLDANARIPLSQLGNLVDGAPAALDTLNELAAAINDDASYAAGITTALGNKQDKVNGVSDIEISYLDGVRSAIQDQLDLKIARSLVDAKGDIIIGSANDTVSRLGVGTNGYLLTANSSATNGVEWAAAPVSLPAQSTSTILNTLTDFPSGPILYIDFYETYMTISKMGYNYGTQDTAVFNNKFPIGSSVTVTESGPYGSNPVVFTVTGVATIDSGTIIVPATVAPGDVTTTFTYERSPVMTGPVTSQAGKYLTTNGTVASWGTIDLSSKANTASPTLTGTPLAPTAATGTNTTQIATTAFVKTEISNSVQPGAVYQTSAPSSPAVGQIWIDSDEDVTTFDSNIIRRKAITATAGQTVFTADLPFIDGFEQIFMNGLLLVKTTDYTTSGGNTVTLTSAAAASDTIEIVSVTGANSVDTYTQAETNALLAANTSVAPLSISANTNLVAKKRYFVTSASALTLTLPASPALNDEIQILDASGNSSTYNITVARNANKINGGNNNLIIDTNGGWYTLLYTGSTYGWKVG